MRKFKITVWDGCLASSSCWPSLWTVSMTFEWPTADKHRHEPIVKWSLHSREVRCAAAYDWFSFAGDRQPSGFIHSGQPNSNGNCIRIINANYIYLFVVLFVCFWCAKWISTHFIACQFCRQVELNIIINDGDVRCVRAIVLRRMTGRHFAIWFVFIEIETGCLGATNFTVTKQRAGTLRDFFFTRFEHVQFLFYFNWSMNDDSGYAISGYIIGKINGFIVVVPIWRLINTNWVESFPRRHLDLTPESLISWIYQYNHWLCQHPRKFMQSNSFLHERFSTMNEKKKTTRNN